jgi:hypothetical protein
MEPNDPTIERHVADAFRRLNDAAVVPPADPAREAALMAAFDAVHGSPGLSERSESKRHYWHLAAFAAAAAVLIAVGVTPALTGRHGLPSGAASAAQTAQRNARDARLEPPSEFVMVPGASDLPPMESGTLVRIDVPVAMLASYGVAPPPGRGATVTADLVIAQDGLPRAVRLVAP